MAGKSSAQPNTVGNLTVEVLKCWCLPLQVGQDRFSLSKALPTDLYIHVHELLIRIRRSVETHACNCICYMSRVIAYSAYDMRSAQWPLQLHLSDLCSSRLSTYAEMMPLASKPAIEREQACTCNGCRHGTWQAQTPPKT